MRLAAVRVHAEGIARLIGPLWRDALPVAGAVLALAVAAEGVGRMASFIGVDLLSVAVHMDQTRRVAWALVLAGYLVIAFGVVRGHRLLAAVVAWVMFAFLFYSAWTTDYSPIWDGWQSSTVYWSQAEELINPLFVALALSFNTRRGVQRVGNRRLVTWFAATVIVFALAVFPENLASTVIYHPFYSVIEILGKIALMALAVVAGGIAIRSRVGRRAAILVTPLLAMPLADTVASLYYPLALLIVAILPLAALAGLALVTRQERQRD